MTRTSMIAGRIGVGAFAFFLIKGLVWLALAGAAAGGAWML